MRGLEINLQYRWISCLDLIYKLGPFSPSVAGGETRLLFQSSSSLSCESGEKTKAISGISRPKPGCTSVRHQNGDSTTTGRQSSMTGNWWNVGRGAYRARGCRGLCLRCGHDRSGGRDSPQSLLQPHDTVHLLHTRPRRPRHSVFRGGSAHFPVARGAPRGPRHWSPQPPGRRHQRINHVHFKEPRGLSPRTVDNNGWALCFYLLSSSGVSLPRSAEKVWAFL